MAVHNVRQRGKIVDKLSWCFSEKSFSNWWNHKVKCSLFVLGKSLDQDILLFLYKTSAWKLIKNYFFCQFCQSPGYLASCYECCGLLLTPESIISDRHLNLDNQLYNRVLQNNQLKWFRAWKVSSFGPLYYGLEISLAMM